MAAAVKSVTLLKPYKHSPTNKRHSCLVAFFLTWPSQMWVVINSSWTTHIFISATKSIKQGHTNGVQLSTALAYFLTVMRILMTSNYILLPAQGLTLIIFDSFEVHLVTFPFILSSGFCLMFSHNLENVFSIISAYFTSPYRIMIFGYDRCNCVSL